MKKIILSLALLSSVAFAEISAPITINEENKTFEKFYGNLIYKINKTPTENYLVNVYLVSKEYAKILYDNQGDSILSKDEKDIQAFFISEKFTNLLSEYLQKNNLSDASIKISSYHEAGHLLVLSFLNEPKYQEVINSINVSVNTQKYNLHDRRAAVFFKNLENEDAKYIDTYLLSLLGGMASEEIAFNTHHTGVTNDLDKWNKYLPIMFTTYPQYIKDKNYCDLSKYSMNPITPLQITQNNQQIDLYRQNQFQFVKTFLNKNRALLDEVAATLQEKHSLNNDEVKEIYKRIKY